MPFADRAYLLDNAGERHRLIYAIKAGRVKFRAAQLPGWAVTALA